jgi:hypothetical protein
MFRGAFMVLLAVVSPIFNLGLNHCQAVLIFTKFGEVAFWIGTLVDIELSLSSG